jgi:hypothetical protein
MKKLRLDLESLEVESFAVDAKSARRSGTVLGAGVFNKDPGDTSYGGSSGDIFCISNAPCVPSDVGSCGGTCEFTCVGFNTCHAPCQSV